MKIQQLLDKLLINTKVTPTIENAFIHSSYVNENRDMELEDNERLEFLGDAVLQVWISNHLYTHPSHFSEGNMTTLRAQLVCEKSLANYAREIDLGNCLFLGVGEERNSGRNRDSILANCFEAFLGAIYLEVGFEVVDKLLNDIIAPKVDLPKTELVVDYKTMLQEYIQSDTRQTVKYEVVQTEGPSNAPVFHVVVKLENIILGTGVGTSKKRAEQKAAQDACMKLAV